MTNIERLKMEIKDIDTPDEEIEIYLQENDLNAEDKYEPASNSNKKAIYKTALNILESIANSPQTMKNYKTDDLSISHFHTNLMQRIDYLNRKIRLMADDDNGNLGDGATIGYLFTE